MSQTTEQPEDELNGDFELALLTEHQRMCIALIGSRIASIAGALGTTMTLELATGYMTELMSELNNARAYLRRLQERA
jgi:hypothetical protein